MLVVNLMFSKGLGGIEQSFLDYTIALKSRNHQVISITSPNAAVNNSLKAQNLEFKTFRNLGHWDFFAKYKIRSYLNSIKPDIILTHGNRALSLVKNLRNTYAIIYVAHNYNIKTIPANIAVFAITPHLCQFIKDNGYQGKSIYPLPNAIHLGDMPKINPAHIRRIFDDKSPATICAMGRFVENKGLRYLIEAVSLLNKEGYPVKLIIGGDGKEKQLLTELITIHKIEHITLFTGWVSNKSEFFKHCDIFVIPSIHEPFGIIVLESFKYGLPTIVTDTDGPCSIVTNNKDALMVPKMDAHSIAEALKDLINHPDKRVTLAKEAQKTVKNYSIENFAKKMEDYLMQILSSKHLL